MTYREVIDAYEQAFINRDIELTPTNKEIIRAAIADLPDLSEATVDEDILDLIAYMED